MNDIIEKLGITPIGRKYNKKIWDTVFSQEEVREIEQQRNELLEALIKIHDAQFNHSKSLAELNSTIRFTRNLIEKATDMKWQEIKELI